MESDLSRSARPPAPGFFRLRPAGLWILSGAMTPAVKDAFDRLYLAIRAEIIDKVQSQTQPEPAPIPLPSSKRAMRPVGEVDKLAERILAHITATPGQSMGEIRKAIGITATDAQFPMRKLRETKRVLIKGTRAAARYFPSQKRVK